MMHKLTRAALALFALAMMSVAALAADPGAEYNQNSEVNDQKAGSLLVYNIYTSTPAGITEDTRINLTNTSGSQSAQVHFFFIEGASCSVADMKMCLTPNQTVSLLAHELDPGVRGYLIVVATDDDGCPTRHNFLIGDEYVKFAPAPGSNVGATANLGAEAFSALDASPNNCNATATATGTALLAFTGQGIDDLPTAALKATVAATYNRVPRVLALDNIQSRMKQNETRLIINRIGGNLAVSAGPIGPMFGILYDDNETPLSFTISANCQYNQIVSGATIRTAPRFESFVPNDRSGWIKLFAANDRGILGSAINNHPNAAGTLGAFVGGHNLHKLTLVPLETLVMPVFPAKC